MGAPRRMERVAEVGVRATVPRTPPKTMGRRAAPVVALKAEA